MEKQDRLHALDAVRAYALLLGIVLHATMSFLPALAARGWPIVDNSPSDTLSVTFSVIHIFRMTTFFVMAGFFARLVLYRRGMKEFIRDRRKRILVPFAASWPLVLALIGASMSWALLKAGKPLVPPPAPPAGSHVFLPFPLTHLWFLYVLLLLYVWVLGVRWLANTVVDRNGKLRTMLDAALRFTTDIPLAPFILAAPVAAALYATPNWVTWGGIPTPDNSLIPNLAATVGYATAITVGWFLQRQSQILASFQRWWVGYFAAALALTIVCLNIGGTPAVTEPINLVGTLRALYAGLYGVAIWCWTFAILGAASRFLSTESPVRRYLADSSYWLYILHLPLVFALQALVTDWPIHWAFKFTFIVGVAVGLLLLSYHYWVRPTYIGEVLNGKRFPRRPTSTPVQEAMPGQ